jgi:hypothetical protein
MNFKTVIINLLLSTLSAGVLLQTLEAQAASITFGTWGFERSLLTGPPNTRFANGNSDANSNTDANGNVTGFTTKAFAQAASTNDPLSWGSNSAIARIKLNSSFTVTPETGERNGDQIKAVLDGMLGGFYANSGLDEPGSNFFTTVLANVNVGGFASWRSTRPIGTDEIPPGGNPNDYIVFPPRREPITEAFFMEGDLTIGETYAFEMILQVSASKDRRYQATSNFGGDGGLTANIRQQPVPEPLTMLGAAAALGYGAIFKRKYSKKTES